MFLKIRIKKEDYKSFQEVCEKKGKTMSDVLRTFIDSYTKAPNIILFDVDNELLKNSVDICREKKIRFNDLMRYLLDKAIKNKDKINFKE